MIFILYISKILQYANICKHIDNGFASIALASALKECDNKLISTVRMDRVKLTI